MPHCAKPRGQVSDILTEEIEELNLTRAAKTITYVVDTFTYPWHVWPNTLSGRVLCGRLL